MRIGLAGTGRIGAFHAATLAALDEVEQVVVTDVVPQSAARLAEERGYALAADLDDLLSQVDGLVITTSTSGHAPTLRTAVAAGVPTFCEKPVAATLDETVELVKLVEASDVPVHVGFQRRFDAGYRRARAAVQSRRARLRAHGPGQHPRPVAAAGGLPADQRRAVPRLQRPRLRHHPVRDRSRGGQRVRRRRQQGRRRSSPRRATSTPVRRVLTLDDGTLVWCRRRGTTAAGTTYAWRCMGSAGTIGVGYDDSLAVRSAEPGVDYPRGPQKWSFMERFQPAYVAELTAFCDVVAGRIASPCTVGGRARRRSGSRRRASAPARPAGRRPSRRDRRCGMSSYELVSMGRTGRGHLPAGARRRAGGRQDVREVPRAAAPRTSRSRRRATAGARRW